jgi:hypothetical protein
LEFSGTQLTDFVPVRWLRACIHIPPPNQIVYVKLDTGIENAGEFTPVWVTGKMTVNVMESLGDRNAEVSAREHRCPADRPLYGYQERPQ